MSIHIHVHVGRYWSLHGTELGNGILIGFPLVYWHLGIVYKNGRSGIKVGIPVNTYSCKLQGFLIRTCRYYKGFKPIWSGLGVVESSMGMRPRDMFA